VVRCDADGCSAEARIPPRTGDRGVPPLPQGWLPSVFYPRGLDRSRRTERQPWRMQHYCPGCAAGRLADLARGA